MNGRSFGYARVFTDDQDLTLQIDALTQHGIPKSNIFTDKLSGAGSDRPGLSKCLDALQRGDVLVVWRLDRLGRSMRHLITLVEDLRARGIGFRSLNEGAIDTTNASGELIFNKSISIDDICQTLNISRSTYYRYLSMDHGDTEDQSK